MRYWQENKRVVIFAKSPLPGGRERVYVSFKSTESEDVLMLSATVMRRLEALGDISKQGTLPDRAFPKKYVNGEPDTLKGVRPVLRGGVG